MILEIDSATLGLEHAIFLAALLSAIPLGGIAAVGLLTAVVQAATQIQEQTISYVIKITTFGVIVFVGGSWILEELVSLLQVALENLPQISAEIRTATGSGAM